ncbi:helix-turn-helix domain-containing protein [Paenibacillus sp. LMG 31460]|uniref:Helix-turn-helix domain-containing protein n=1 Tax=Paenibacillus germinis TaxID=2654979 RepID=A0ABX1Z6L2_9BACL|nr:helix-turn-helix domain-containing protein [Paenibacillus germinis]NOU87500.1 helix-turn-helix domain-containing protein [Paenibacillus germinis]
MNNFRPGSQIITSAGAHIRKALTETTEALSEITCRSKSYRFEERHSDSPFVETIWRTPIETITPTYINSGPYIFPAVRHWGLVVAKLDGKITLTLWGPGTKAAPAPCPRETEIFGIMFKPGAFMPHLPLSLVRDRRDIVLPDATSKSFWMNGSALQFPDYENADTFVDQLVRCGHLVRDDLVDAVLQGQLKDVSLRSVQRRFLQATGLTHNTVRQMERAKFAKELLLYGTSIFDTIDQAGYYDQAHLTRSLKHFIGLTPVQIVRLSYSQ